MNSCEDTQMVLIATNHHEGLGRPFQSWMPNSRAEMLLSGYLPAEGSLDNLALAFHRLTKTGEQSNWYVRVGPITLAELEEWYATGTRDGEPFPGGDRPPERNGEDV